MDRLKQASAALAHQAPCTLWRHFLALCAIPHGSGHEEALADYVQAQACRLGLRCVRDRLNNILVHIPATEGLEQANAVLLQGHMDMVCEKEPDSPHCFDTDPLTTVEQDGWIYAAGTTLGGDDGVAVAMMLALMEGVAAVHPPLECLFTVSEEVGMEGARAFDPQAAGLRATRMINLDSEQEATLTAGCAGGVRTDVTLPAAMELSDGDDDRDCGRVFVRVRLEGLCGGHSGVEIHKGYQNAIKQLGLCLLEAQDEAVAGPFSLVSAFGGGKDNAIPREAEVLIAVASEAAAHALIAHVHAWAAAFRTRPDVRARDRAARWEATIQDAPSTVARSVSAAFTRRLLGLLCAAPVGVLATSAEPEGFPALSRNLGIFSLKLQGDGPAEAKLTFSSRACSEALLDQAQRELEVLAAAFGGRAQHHDRYPGWNYASHSPLREIWQQEYTRLTGKPLTVEVIHAGLECGLLTRRIPGLDAISVGPDMEAIHTPAERLSIASTERIFTVLCRVLERLASATSES